MDVAVIVTKWSCKRHIYIFINVLWKSLCSIYSRRCISRFPYFVWVFPPFAFVKSKLSWLHVCLFTCHPSVHRPMTRCCLCVSAFRYLSLSGFAVIMWQINARCNEASVTQLVSPSLRPLPPSSLFSIFCTCSPFPRDWLDRRKPATSPMTVIIIIVCLSDRRWQASEAARQPARQQGCGNKYKLPLVCLHLSSKFCANFGISTQKKRVWIRCVVMAWWRVNKLASRRNKISAGLRKWGVLVSHLL